jgi:hypothetical protein
MSLWTPDGEHEVPHDDDDIDDGDVDLDLEDLSPEERERLEAMAREMSEVRAQLLSVPAADVVANHAIGFYELAAIHLGADPPHIGEARVAIDAMGAVVETLEGRLGRNEGPLRDALAQIRLAFVQMQAAAGQGQGPTPDS